MGFPRQEYWSGLPFPFLGDLPNPGVKPVCPAFGRGLLYHWAIREALCISMPASDMLLYSSHWFIFREPLPEAIISRESEQLMTYIVRCTWFHESFPCFVAWFDILCFFSPPFCNKLWACSWPPAVLWISRLGEQEGMQSACQTPGLKSAKGGRIIFLCYCLLSWHLV